MSQSQNLKQKTRKQFMDEAFTIATNGLAADLPIMIQGSGGGIHPISKDKPENAELEVLAARDTQHLVAALTVQYIHRLVDAALDAREMLIFGDRKHHNDMRNVLPPPPLDLSNQNWTPKTTESIKNNDDTRKRRAATNWDDPLPSPKIRGRPSANTIQQNNDRLNANSDEWIGVAGVDLWQNSRARTAYVRNRALSAQHFMFPLCHDSYVYGRIREVQATKLTVTEPILHDTTIWDTVRTEGKIQQEEVLRNRRILRQKSKNSSGIHSNRQKLNHNDDNDDDHEDSDIEDEDGPMWPGLSDLLPANCGKFIEEHQIHDNTPP